MSALVYKFGGTSVASCQALRRLLGFVSQAERPFVYGLGRGWGD